MLISFLETTDLSAFHCASSLALIIHSVPQRNHFIQPNLFNVTLPSQHDFREHFAEVYSIAICILTR